MRNNPGETQSGEAEKYRLLYKETPKSIKKLVGNRRLGTSVIFPRNGEFFCKDPGETHSGEAEKFLKSNIRL